MNLFSKKYKKEKTDKPAWGGKSRGGYFGYRFFICLINRLGIRFAYLFLSLVVVHFIPFAPKATQSNWKYFRTIQGFGFFKSVRMLYLGYYRFGQILIDKIAVRSGHAQKYSYEFENYPAFLDLLDHSHGVILIGAHAGNWEIGGNFFGEYAKKINIVMFDAEYQKIKTVLDKNLNPVSHKVISISETDFTHIYQIKAALEKGEYVCFQGDRFVGDKSTVSVNFMGKPARFPLGPFLLAARFDVPVVFYYSMREKGMKYKFRFTMANVDKNKKNRQFCLDLLNLYVISLEKIVQAYPEQWFNYYDFWKK
ncbi:MAG: acyltransferase [Candidatus Symbiothrix sp.]|jgi:predicted LPLAT superfamily acyltransferase|nr:acyltransferase [Candidatus Symbiothrix sp.]